MHCSDQTQTSQNPIAKKPKFLHQLLNLTPEEVMLHNTDKQEKKPGWKKVSLSGTFPNENCEMMKAVAMRRN